MRLPREDRDALVAAISAVRGEVAQIADALAASQTARLRIITALAAVQWQPSSAVRHLHWAPIGRTRLEASLIGVTDDMLDAHPLPGEWSIRQQLAHVALTYERYTIACQYTANRADDEPIRTPASLYPDRIASPEGNRGEPLSDIIARHRHAWDAAIEPLLTVPTEVLQRSTEWHGAEHTLAFRLHRFGAHDLEIATDLRATVVALGVRETESLVWARALLEEWGELESALLGVPDDVTRNSGANAILDSLREADRACAHTLS